MKELVSVRAFAVPVEQNEGVILTDDNAPRAGVGVGLLRRGEETLVVLAMTTADCVSLHALLDEDAFDRICGQLADAGIAQMRGDAPAPRAMH